MGNFGRICQPEGAAILYAWAESPALAMRAEPMPINFLGRKSVLRAFWETHQRKRHINKCLAGLFRDFLGISSLSLKE